MSTGDGEVSVMAISTSTVWQTLKQRTATSRVQ